MPGHQATRFCTTLPFWHLQFWGGCQIFGKFVGSCMGLVTNKWQFDYCVWNGKKYRWIGVILHFEFWWSYIVLAVTNNKRICVNLTHEMWKLKSSINSLLEFDKHFVKNTCHVMTYRSYLAVLYNVWSIFQFYEVFMERLCLLEWHPVIWCKCTAVVEESASSIVRGEKCSECARSWFHY